METSHVLTIVLPKYKIFNCRFGKLIPVTIRLALSDIGFFLVFLDNPIDATLADLVKYRNNILYSAKLALAQEYNMQSSEVIMSSDIYETIILNKELNPTSDLHPVVKLPAIEKRSTK